MGGTGYLGSVTVNAGGHLAPGNAPGVLHLSGNLVLASSASLDYELDTPARSDMLSMLSGNLTFNGQQFSDFNFTWSANFAPGSYTLIGAGSISGLGSNLSGTIDGLPASLSLQGNDLLVLNVVPEPSTLALPRRRRHRPAGLRLAKAATKHHAAFSVAKAACSFSCGWCAWR